MRCGAQTTTDTSAEDHLRALARERCSFGDLRPRRLIAAAALVRGRDALVVMPTGHDGSAVHRLAALALDGPTLVVHPAQGRERTAEARRRLEDGEAAFVFLSPEQLAREDVLDRLAALHPSLLVVAESHGVSARGHDFRPDHLRLGDVVDRLGHPVVAALTATASPPVRAEVVERLRMSDPLEVVQGFDRPNPHLEVHRCADAEEERREVVLRGAGPTSRCSPPSRPSSTRPARSTTARAGSRGPPTQEPPTLPPTPAGPGRPAVGRRGRGRSRRGRRDAPPFGRSRPEVLRGYAETTTCRRGFLLGCFGEEHPHRCGSCDVCRARPVDASDREPDAPSEPAPPWTTLTSSVGFFGLGHPELLLVDTDPRLAALVLGELFDAVVEGDDVLPGQERSVPGSPRRWYVEEVPNPGDIAFAATRHVHGLTVAARRCGLTTVGRWSSCAPPVWACAGGAARTPTARWCWPCTA